MQGIKFRDFMSVVCTSNWNSSPTSAKLNRGKNSFALPLVLVSKWEYNVVMVIYNCIKSQLSYFIVGQGKECTYVYFHISVMVQDIMLTV